jgi:hypothetical protein
MPEHSDKTNDKSERSSSRMWPEIAKCPQNLFPAVNPVNLRAFHRTFQVRGVDDDFAVLRTFRGVCSHPSVPGSCGGRVQTERLAFWHRFFTYPGSQLSTSPTDVTLFWLQHSSWT